MSVAIVNDWKFKKNADIPKAIEAASELVEDFKKNHSGVQLSLWLKNQNDALHYWHITVFDSQENLDEVRKSDGIKKFVEKFYPHMDQATHNNPQTDVVILSAQNLKELAYQNTVQ